MSAVSRATTPGTEPLRSRVPVLATALLAVIATAVIGSRLWSPGIADLRAAVRFEVRLAEENPAAGLQAARVDADRIIYLHPEVIVTNSDIAKAGVVPGDSPSHFGVLMDGKVVMAPTVRDAISALATINGDLTQAEAERIVNGIGVQ